MSSRHSCNISLGILACMDEGVSASIQRSEPHGVAKADSRMEGKCRPFGDGIIDLQGVWDGSTLTFAPMHDASLTRCIRLGMPPG